MKIFSADDIEFHYPTAAGAWTFIRVEDAKSFREKRIVLRVIALRADNTELKAIPILTSAGTKFCSILTWEINGGTAVSPKQSPRLALIPLIHLVQVRQPKELIMVRFSRSDDQSSGDFSRNELGSCDILIDLHSHKSHAPHPRRLFELVTLSAMMILFIVE